MNYQIMKLNTVWSKGSKLGGLTFIESERDIPFAIKSIYCIYKTEQNQRIGFRAHKESWQLLFCPYGVIDIVLTDGTEKETITLDNPSKGLVLQPGLWGEVIWQQDDAVLCMAASERCDSDEYIQNHMDFLLNRKNQDKVAEVPGGECFKNAAGDVRDVKMLKFPSMDSQDLSIAFDAVSFRSIVIESLRDVPFEIKRIFYIFGEENIGRIRGMHANRKSEFVLFNVSGSSKVKVIDEDLSESVYELNEPNDAVYLPRMIWKEMYDFSPNSVLMVVTNAYYDETEYVRDFNAFAEEIREMKKSWE